uniref:Mab-21 domain-containing protein n=1 Tax=Macrostomum lignano TaxID=282301 RepID=A0A1I8FRH8_9PLAT
NSKRDPDELASIELYEHLNQAGINDRGASKQCRAADGLEDAARQLNPDERLLIGSLAEGWSLSLLTDPQGNGLGKDSIKWLSFKIEDQAHLDVDPVTLKFPNNGSRPSQEIRQVYKCCRPNRADRVRLLLPKGLSCTSACTVLELDTESGELGQLKVSFKLQEKQIMRRLSTIQGQLYVLLLLVFKRLLPEAPGSIRSLRACHAKALLFFMISGHSNSQQSAWTKEKLISLLKESLGMLVNYLTATKTPGDCMPNFFMPDATLRLKSTSKAGRIDFKKEKIALLKGCKDVTPLLNFVKNRVSARESDRVFQLFTALPMVELNDFEAFTGDALLYLLVQHLFNEIPKLQLIKITPYGSGNMLQVNFHSLLMSLQAELLSKEQIFLNEWRRALEPDPDIDELYALAHYSRNTEQIRKCSKKIRELLDCENRGLGDAQKHWSVARKACFNGLFMVTMLAAALAALSRVPILISDGPV